MPDNPVTPSTVHGDEASFQVIEQGQGHPVPDRRGFPDTVETWRNRMRGVV